MVESGLGVWSMMKKGTFAAIMLAALCAAGPAFASPWAEVGDNQLRADIEILAAAGAIDDVTIHWPLPWQGIIGALRSDALADQPAYVRLAAARVLARARAQNKGGLSASVELDGTNRADTVYGFDGMGRGQGQAQFIMEFNSQNTAARVAFGAITGNFRGRTIKLMPDESYLAEKFGPVLLYGGYLSHWWGPGWMSALSLSNNARPMPQLGIERLETSRSTWPVLNLLGPWRAEFLVGMLDGPRIQPDTFYNALRFSFSPVQGLQIAIARTEEFCGQGHSCVPVRDYFDFNNDPLSVNHTNDQGVIDIKYSHTLMGVPAEVYMQLMNEDSSPFVHSGTSHLFGGSLYLPMGDSPVRLTMEYTDSVPTSDIFSFGNVMHGFAYNNSGYPDGMRYRGRSLGFSLGSDSTLLSAQAAWSDTGGRFYQLSLHHAAISNPANLVGNVVTTTPVHVNMGEARVTLPLRWLKLDLAGRLQDDQPRPHHGFAASLEAGLRINL